MFKSNNKYIQCTNKNKYFYKLLIKIKDTSHIFYKKTLNRIVRKKKYESYIN